jgi:uncharacterized protein YbbC (DUF1343 family)
MIMKYIFTVLVLFVPVCVIAHDQFKLGLETITPLFIKQLQHADGTPYRIGLITNQTGVDRHGTRNIDILLEKKIHIVRLFAPEHGIDGKTTAGAMVTNTQDEKTGLPVVSLYGNGKGKNVDPVMLQDLDALMFDMQDSGMRHYTYISTLFCVLKAAVACNKHLIVLDRPNPLGPRMEGPLVDPGLESFISIAPIPLRHGMTIGELAWFFNYQVLPNPAPLTVVKMENHNRIDGLMGELKNPLSPNIQSLHSVYGYSFLGLLGEIEPFDVGVGTAKAFACIMVPVSHKVAKVSWDKLVEQLKKQGVNAYYYTYYNTRKKKQYEGVELQKVNINELASFELFLSIIHHFKAAGVKLTCSRLFDKAVGTSLVQSMMHGLTQRTQVVIQVNSKLKEFFTKAKSAFMYEPYPIVHTLVSNSSVTGLK